MKIEKISDNQIRCTLTRADLADRQLQLSELAYGTEKAKSLFRDMMQQAAFEFGFEAEDIPLMIEAIPSADSIVLIITKVEDPEELDTRFSKFAPSSIADAKKKNTPGKLEGAEANPLLFRCDGFRHAFIFRLNADVGRVPVSIPVRTLCRLCVIERGGFALRHRVLPALPEVVPLLTVEQHDSALVDLHGLPRRKQNIRRRGDGFALGGCGGFAGQRQPCAAKLLLIR